MQVKFTFRKAAELGIFLAAISALILAGCGGGSSSSTTPPTTLTYTYTVSAGVGEVLQFTINKTNLTYSYSVIKTSYAASGVSAGQTATGALTDSGSGFYAVGTSSDNFIQDGKLFPVNDGLLAGHVRINSIGGANRIPVFGVSNPITQLASLAGTYNFQGFACGAPGIANVTGNPACSTNYGTITIDAVGNVTKCDHGDITTAPTTNPCALTQSKTLQVIAATPGVFDFWDSVTGHTGWFFAYTAANGQKVAVIDNDDAVALRYGHAVLSTYIGATSSVISGNYFKNDNEGNERIVTINGSAYSNDNGFAGTISYNSPWNGFSTFSVTSSGVTATGLAMTTGSGAFTHQLDTDPQFFASGLKY
ncbi:MAG: hypothetical protein PHQ60_15955 [Sideroxydans sp.]|nr:hypothetical protein [Sideroxydans sp.]